MADLFHSPIFDKIRGYLTEHNSRHHTIFIFVPYIKTATLAELLEDMSGRVVVVTTWKPRDIQFGSSELELYPYCQKRRITLYVSDSMHLKVYSADLDSAILVTGNISRRGMLSNGNYEAGIRVGQLTNENRLFFERIRNEARLVDDSMYDALAKWVEANKIDRTDEIRLEDIIPEPKKDDFLVSALPMTRRIDDLIAGYARIQKGLAPSDDEEVSACVFHDIANYDIKPGLLEDELVRSLTSAFFAHPFIRRIDEFIAPEAYFGRIKEWVQNNCTDVPVPSRRELTGNVQVLLEWFVRLGGGKYVIDVPGARSQCIRNTGYGSKEPPLF